MSVIIKQSQECFRGRCDSDQKPQSIKGVWCTKAAEWISWQAYFGNLEASTLFFVNGQL